VECRWPPCNKLRTGLDTIEVVCFAFGIGALDSGDALRVVPAVQEPRYGRADPLEPEPPEAFGEVNFIAGVQVGEVRVLVIGQFKY
jgi:hypothetical protein